MVSNWNQFSSTNDQPMNLFLPENQKHIPTGIFKNQEEYSSSDPLFYVLFCLLNISVTYKQISVVRGLIVKETKETTTVGTTRGPRGKQL